MKIVTFINEENGNDNNAPCVGALINDGAHILDFTRLIEIKEVSVLAWFDMNGELFKQAQVAYKKAVANIENAREKGLLIERAKVHLLAPVPRPNKLICIGLNYRDHAAESKLPVPESPIIFSKFTTSVIGPNESVILPATSRKVDYEAEFAFVMGRYTKRVSRDKAYDYVLGYTVFNDVSARDFQFADGQWQRGKSCDTFAPMGEAIVTTDEVADPHNLYIKLRLNGETMQDSNTNQLIFGVPELVEFLSETITLEPGDVVATGTPPGVGFARKPPVYLKDGDVMEVEIEKLGILTNKVVAAK